MLHFTTSFGIYLFLTKHTKHALLITYLIGIAKEFYDLLIKSTYFDPTDVFHNILGIALAIILIKIESKQT